MDEAIDCSVDEYANRSDNEETTKPEPSSESQV